MAEEIKRETPAETAIEITEKDIKTTIGILTGEAYLQPEAATTTTETTGALTIANQTPTPTPTTALHSLAHK